MNSSVNNLTIIKSRKKPGRDERVDTCNAGGKHGVLCSAIWQIRELPGIFLSADGRRGDCSLWRVRYHAVAYQYGRQQLSRQIAEQMQGQLFQSRQEALRALAMGMEIHSPTAKQQAD